MTTDDHHTSRPTDASRRTTDSRTTDGSLSRRRLLGAAAAATGGLAIGSPSASAAPYGGMPHPVPGRIQAEEYDTGGEGTAYHDTTTSNQGGAFRTGERVDVESSSAGSGYNVGWIVTGEWLEYTVDVAESGTYDLHALVASAAGGGAFRVEVDGTDVTGTVSAPGTGDWQAWTTITSGGVDLAAGQRVVRVYVEDGDFNLNWFEFELVDGGGGAPTAPTNLSSPAQTTTSVDLDWDHDGANTSYYNVYVDGQWNSTADGTATTVTGLDPSTTYEFHVTADDGSGTQSPDSNVISVSTDADGGGGGGQQPYPGSPHPIPGRIQAQEYDTGGEGVAYHDTTSSNQGGAFRTDETVDVEVVSDSTGGSYNVGWTADGEWLEYTVDVAESGTYDVDVRVASDGMDGTLSVHLGDTDVTGPVDVPDTGGWQSWTTVTASGVSLTAGQQVLRLSVDVGGFNVNWLEVSVADDGSDPGGDEHPVMGYEFGGSAPADELTHVIRTFASVANDGSVTPPSGIDGIAGTKTVLSIGGWGNSGGFPHTAADQSSREHFASECVAIMRQHDLDGIDIDWEFPGPYGPADLDHYEDDVQNFSALLEECRRQFDDAGTQDGTSYTLSAALNPTPSRLQELEHGRLQDALDYVKVMTYDYHAMGWSDVTNHNSPLYTNPDSPSPGSIHDSLETMRDLGWPNDRVVMGLAFYGREFTGVQSTANGGLFQDFSDGGSGNAYGYSEIAAGFDGYTRYWDDAAKVPYLFDGSTFVSYDDPESIAIKAEYAADRGHPIMYWATGHDPNETLVGAVNDALGK